MQATNGFDLSTVLPALTSRVLWQSQNVNSDSGRYFEDFHPLCNMNIVQAVMPDSTIPVATYLANESRAVVMSALNAVFNKPELVDHTKLAFKRTDRLYLQTIPNQSQFAGLNLLFGSGQYGIQSHNVLLFFDKAVSFNLYLYNDMALAPVVTLPVTVKAWEQTVIELPETFILNNLTPTLNKGGRWYLGYYQDDIAALGAHALYYNMEYSTFAPLQVMAFSASLKPNPVDQSRNFDRNLVGAANLMYGMNLEISTYRDSTNNIVQNAQLFDELIGLHMAARIVEKVIYNTRDNATERRMISNDAVATLYHELNQGKATDENPWSVGLREKISREIFRVKQGFQKRKRIMVGMS